MLFTTIILFNLMVMKTHKKIYYVGGMISLIFTPVIFWIYVKPTYDNLSLRVLDLVLPYKAEIGEKTLEHIVIPIDGYKYDIVNVPKNFNDETLTLIEKIKNNNIDKTGIKFQLSDKNSYGDLVKLINLMLKANQDEFGLDTEKTNTFYMIHRKVESNEVICGGGIIGCEYSNEYLDENDYDYKHSNFFKIKYSPKETYYLILGYIILVYFSLNRMFRLNEKTLKK
ncbi:hypothetical protein FO675_02605 [Riemerella anatipestifer]|nr:hypothetical protein [Riemerella anatipestifer]